MGTKQFVLTVLGGLLALALVAVVFGVPLLWHRADVQRARALQSQCIAAHGTWVKGMCIQTGGRG